jgi:endonuclease/exonuclease/phosphatase family metal-dependent hydrolase
VAAGLALTEADKAPGESLSALSDPTHQADQASRSGGRSQVARPGGEYPDATTPPPYHVVKAPSPYQLKPAVEARLRRAAELAAHRGEPFTFKIGSLNVLGSNHTPPRSGYASGTTRAVWESDLIESVGIDLIGLQEVQPDQLHVFVSQLGGYSVWPQETLGRNSYRRQIAWRDDLFELKDTGSITTIFSGQLIPLPYVLLEDRLTGGQFYAVTIHNSPRGMESERDAATGAEIGLIKSLLASGHPVVVTGDMNEPTEWYCAVAASTGVVGANGAYYDGGCHTPGHNGIDWIVGGGGVDFSDYVRKDDINKMSDHPIIWATATLQD